MSSTKETQAARSAADRILREENAVRYAELMQAEYDKRDLGQYKRKTTPEERAERERLAAQERAAEKAREWAAKGGFEIAILPKGSEVRAAAEAESFEGESFEWDDEPDALPADIDEQSAV